MHQKWFLSYSYLRKPDIWRILNPHSITWIRDNLKEGYFIKDDYGIQINGSRFIVYFEGVDIYATETVLLTQSLYKAYTDYTAAALLKYHALRWINLWNHGCIYPRTCSLARVLEIFLKYKLQFEGSIVII